MAYDVYGSCLPLEPDFIAYTPLTCLEGVIDHPLMSLPFVVLSLSSTPRDTLIVDLT